MERKKNISKTTIAVCEENKKELYLVCVANEINIYTHLVKYVFHNYIPGDNRDIPIKQRKECCESRGVKVGVAMAGCAVQCARRCSALGCLC
jgi:hypothetical protein